jgi:calcineurin-like phosphoesterase family protein
MKKYIAIIALALLPFAGTSQSIFDKFEDMDEVSSVIVNKNMFDLLVKMDVNVDEPEAREAMEIAKSLSGLKVFVTENKGISADMKSTVERYLKNASLEELMRVKDKDANVKFYIRKGKDDDHVSELLMFVTGINNVDVEINDRKIETVLLTLTGDIDLTKIGALTKKMNLPKELNQIEKKKS